MNEALTKHIYKQFDTQKLTPEDINNALDYISEMFKYTAAGMDVDYIANSIKEFVNIVFKAAGPRYLNSIQPEDEAEKRIKELKDRLKGLDIYIPDTDKQELLYICGDITEARRRFGKFGIKIHTTQLFRTKTTFNIIYKEIQPAFGDILPEATSHFDEYTNLFALLDYQPSRYSKVEDDPQFEERKEDLQAYIFERIEKPVYAPTDNRADDFNIYDDLLSQEHLLIAGTTGSGKSFVVNRLIERLKQRDNIKMVLFDPKIVELSDHKGHPNTWFYAQDPALISGYLKILTNYMDDVFFVLQNNGLKFNKDKHVYIIIDEFADLVNSDFKAEICSNIQKIAQKGRAAGIHLILCTQRPTREVIPGCISSCLTAKLALRTATAQESRNIIQVNGAETLPKIGKGLYRSPDFIGVKTVNIT